MRVASNGASSLDAPQCGQNRLPSGTVREQDVHVIGGGAYTFDQKRLRYRRHAVSALRNHRIALAMAFLVTSATVPATTPPKTGLTLTRLARVAELYRDTALSFSCEEQIEYKGKTTGRIQFAYLFIHDDKGKFRDYRTWRSGTTAAERGTEVDPANYHVPRFLQSAYLWAFIFRADRQPHHAFFNLGEDTVLGRPALKIGFQPKGSILKGWNDWAGIASIDRETTQILKVEAWSPEHWNRKVKLDADLAAAPKHDTLWESEPYDIESIVTEYTVVKNGMRFPGKVTIVRSVSTVLGGEREWPLRERETVRVTQEYSNYEFFSVRTSEQIRKFVAGDAELPSKSGP